MCNHKKVFLMVCKMIRSIRGNLSKVLYHVHSTWLLHGKLKMTVQKAIPKQGAGELFQLKSPMYM